MKDKILPISLHPAKFQHLWSLDPDVIFLNHGSYGACPLSIVIGNQQFVR